jgi:hypothetical protein
MGVRKIGWDAVGCINAGWTGSRELSKWPSVFIKGGKFLEQLGRQLTAQERLPSDDHFS